MAADVVMPQMGASIFEATITTWLKPPFESSTDKVDAEIPSPSAGVLKEIKVSEGQTVPINTVVAVIDAAGAAAAAPASAKAAPAPAAVPVAAVSAPKPQIVPPPAPQPAAVAPAASAAKEGTRVHSSPLVRRMAKEHGIALTPLPATPSRVLACNQV